MKAKQIISKGMIYAVLIILSLVAIVPFLWMLSSSLAAYAFAKIEFTGNGCIYCIAEVFCGGGCNQWD